MNCVTLLKIIFLSMTYRNSSPLHLSPI